MAHSSSNVIVATGDPVFARLLTEAFAVKDVDVWHASTLQEFVSLIGLHRYSLVLIDRLFEKETCLAMTEQAIDCGFMDVIMLIDRDRAIDGGCYHNCLVCGEDGAAPRDVTMLASGILGLTRALRSTQVSFAPGAPMALSDEGELPDGYGQEWILLRHGWRLISPDGAAAKLTLKEFEFVLVLATASRFVVSRENLLFRLGYQNDAHGKKAMESLVYRFRKKSEALGSQLIDTAYGTGWGLSAPVRIA